jgi:hypothetical protein
VLAIFIVLYNRNKRFSFIVKILGVGCVIKRGNVSNRVITAI